jgi:hypothetical protein
LNAIPLTQVFANAVSVGFGDDDLVGLVSKGVGELFVRRHDCCDVADDELM